MKILIFGGSGQVGRELQRSLPTLGTLLVPGQGGLPRADLTDFAQLENLVATLSPDLIVNAAAYTAVDKAEIERDLAQKINADAPGVLARAAKKISAPLLHYSTDYVFAGTGSEPHFEDDPTRPLNHYGATKLAGEQEVSSAKGAHLIFRTSWVYAPQGRNFPNTMLRLATERDVLQVVNDQHGTPTGSIFLAHNTRLAIQHLQKNMEVTGLYQLVPNGETTWFGLAQYLLHEARASGLLHRLPDLRAIASADFPQAAPRPQNSRLNTEKFRRVFGTGFPDWKVGINSFLGILRNHAKRGLTEPEKNH
jgi:dTDP-4-dehydrorhamnose reductase